MKPRFAVLLHDMLDAANSIKLHTNGITMFSQFISNRTALRAVERELEIIAEAMKLAKKENANFELKEEHKIRGIRNRIIHDYANTNYEIIWGIIVNNIDSLISELNELVKKYEQQ